MAKRRTLKEKLATTRARKRPGSRPATLCARAVCVLLKIAAGQSAHKVAKHALLKARDPDTVYAWLDRYAREGWAGWWSMPLAGTIGAIFEQAQQRARQQAVEQRLHQPPGEEGRQVGGAGSQQSCACSLDAAHGAARWRQWPTTV